MAIRTKTELQNIFVANAVPSQQNYTDWIDSCVFLDSDGSGEINYLKLPDYSVPSTPDAGFKNLFFNSTNSNILSILDESGGVKQVDSNRLVTHYFSNTSPQQTLTLLLSNTALKIISVKVVIIGVGSFLFGAYNGTANGSIDDIQLTGDHTISSNSINNRTLYDIPLLVDTVAINRIVFFGVGSFSGSFQASVTIEYRED